MTNIFVLNVVAVLEVLDYKNSKTHKENDFTQMMIGASFIIVSNVTLMFLLIYLFLKF